MTPAAIDRFKPIREAASRREHGTRARYVGERCRCLLCRAANSRYQCSRDAARKTGDRRELVPATAARLHVHALSRQGVGYKSVAAAAGVSVSVMAKIRSGARLRIRAHAECAILAVTREAVADHALVDAAPTWRLINQLLAGGYTKGWIGQKLGSKAKIPALQLKRDQITASSACKVERLYRLIIAGRISR